MRHGHASSRMRASSSSRQPRHLKRGDNMFRYAVVGFGLMVALQLSAPVHGQQLPDVVLYEGARLIPGDGGAAIEESAFLVDGGAITRVGRKGELSVAGGVKRVDLSGRTVMPALINA